MTSLAIDLGGTTLRIALGDGRSAWRERIEVDRPASPSALVEAMRLALQAWRTDSSDLAGIGVAIAGLVDDVGTVVRAENLGWVDVPLRQTLEAAFGLRAVVDTDVFCGAAFEVREGAAFGRQCALYVSVGTGIGHAFILGGRTWRGASGCANALGHIVVEPGGAPCYCGGRGCLCLVSGGKAQAGEAPPADALSTLALVLANATTLIEPEIIVLAGGALKQSWFDLNKLSELVGAWRYVGTMQPTLQVSAQRDPNLRGAAIMAGDRPVEP